VRLSETPRGGGAGYAAEGGYQLLVNEEGSRAALYNLPRDGEVPGEQLAFYCFNYGDLKAVQYAAGLPWLPLYRAYRMRGWRAQSRGLLRAALLARGIPHG